MLLCFVDETEKRDPSHDTNFFCVVGLIIKDISLPYFHKDIEKVLLDHGFGTSIAAESANLDVKKTVTDEIASVMAKYNVELRACIIQKDQKGFTPELFTGTFGFLLERFYLCCEELGQPGLFILDSHEKNKQQDIEDALYKEINTGAQSWHTSTTSFHPYREFIFPTVMFSRDENCLPLQVVDWVGKSINGALTETCKLQKFSDLTPIEISQLPIHNAYLGSYWPHFKRSPSGKIYGWGIKIWK